MSECIGRIVNLANANCYVEPFCGGAAVLFAIAQHKVEVLNDHNDNVFAFWHSLKTRSDELIAMCKERALYCEKYHTIAKRVINSDSTDEIERAWAFFYLSRSSFGGNITSSFGYQLTNSRVSRLINRIETLGVVANRISQCCIHTRDAIEIIGMYDSKKTVFYIDPPYVGANQGYYSGYKEEDLLALMDCLRKIGGKFILSGYSSGGLMDEFGKEYELEKIATTAKFNKNKDAREEYLVTNFKHSDKKLF